MSFILAWKSSVTIVQPTYHGKGACDGLGGTVKRLAAQTSQKRPIRPYDNQIITPQQLYDWASTTLKGITISLKLSIQLWKFNRKCFRTIPGHVNTIQYVFNINWGHSSATYSTSQTFEEKTRQATDLEIERISSYMTCENWWLSLVLKVGIENSEIMFCFYTQEVLLTPKSILLFQTFSQFFK